MIYENRPLANRNCNDFFNHRTTCKRCVKSGKSPTLFSYFNDEFLVANSFKLLCRNSCAQQQTLPLRTCSEPVAVCSEPVAVCSEPVTVCSEPVAVCCCLFRTSCCLLLFVASAVALCAGSTFSKIVMTLGGGVGLVFVFFGHYYYAAGESVTVIV